MKFVAPTPQTPGFLRRMKRALEFSERLKSGELSPALVDGLVDFLSDFVTDIPKAEAKEQLLDASQEQFTAMLDAINGKASTVPN